MLGLMHRVVVVVAVGVLSVTAALKVATVVSGWHEHEAHDRLLGIPGNWVLVLGVAIECAAVAAILRLHDGFSRGVIIAGLGCQFLLYHMAYSQFGGGCRCLGSVWRWTQTSVISAEWISIALAAWLAVTGTALSFLEWRMRTHLASRG
jgi:hypothetical protein